MPTGRFRRIALAVLFAAGALAAGPAAARAATCPSIARCATLTVPLDHTGAVSGTLSLAYARVPAVGARTGTIVILTGGPGQSAIPFTADLSTMFAALRQSNDLIFLDQRGTGESGAVDCGTLTSESDVTACGDKLGPARAFYTTEATSYDLEALRGALGVDKLTLVGVSYGAKVAGDYARRFPSHTQALVLDSPAPVDGLDDVNQLPALGTARVLREVCNPGACHATVTNPDEALQNAVLELRAGPLSGPLVDSSGKPHTEKVTESDLYEAVTESDLDPILRAGLPAAIASLAAGDAAPFLHLVGGQSSSETNADEGISIARLLATSCVEGRLPWAPDSPVAGRTDALKAFISQRELDFAPFSATTVASNSIAALCAAWPPTPAPPAIAGQQGPDVPVLVLSGRDDLRTPTEDARRTAAQYPHATLLTIPGTGHSVLTTETGDCALAGVTAFLAGQAVQQCTAHNAGSAVPNLPFLPATIAKLKPTHLKGLAGRTVTAASLTISSAAQELIVHIAAGSKSTRVPGLRSGYLSGSAKGVEFHNLSWFKGVVLNGHYASSGNARLTISGPDAAPGVIFAQGRHTFATFGGVTTRIA